MNPAPKAQIGVKPAGFVLRLASVIIACWLLVPAVFLLVLLVLMQPEPFQPPEPSSDSGIVLELVQNDAQTRAAEAQREADQRAQQAAAEQAQREADQRARQATAEQAQREADQRAQQAAAEQTQREADQRAQQAAAEQAQREADQRAQQAAAEQAQREADQHAQQAAAEQAQREADQRAQQAAAEQAQREADQRAQQAAAEQAQREADQRAQQAAARNSTPVVVTAQYRNKSGIRISSYPKKFERQFKKDGLVATTIVTVYLDREGKPTKAVIKEPSGYTKLDDFALKSVRRSTYFPAKVNGQAVLGIADIAVEFDPSR